MLCERHGTTNIGIVIDTDLTLEIACPPPEYQDSALKGCVDPITTPGELTDGMCCWTCRLVCG